MIKINREIIGILSVVFGILIILVPEIIGYLIGGYLILFGVLTLLGKSS